MAQLAEGSFNHPAMRRQHEPLGFLRPQHCRQAGFEARRFDGSLIFKRIAQHDGIQPIRPGGDDVNRGIGQFFHPPQISFGRRR